MHLVGISGYEEAYVRGISFICDQVQTQATLPSTIEESVSPIVGGMDGEYFTFDCPDGEYLVNLGGQADDPKRGYVVHAINVTCSGGKNITRGGPWGIPHSNPDCPGGFTGFAIWRYIHVKVIKLVCNGSSDSSLGGAAYPYVDPVKFTCPPGMRFVGISGYSRLYLNSVSFTCGPTTPALTANTSVNVSYDLVEPHPKCYSKLGPQYCPPPLPGLQFTDVYMVSGIIVLTTHEKDTVRGGSLLMLF